MSNLPQLDWTATDERAVDLIRVLAMDSVQKVGNGHPGTAMSLARKASGAILTALAPVLPELWGGSADLAESNLTTMEGEPSFIPVDHQTEMWPGNPHDSIGLGEDGPTHQPIEQARDRLAGEGISARVVSMPCVEWFNAQEESYRREVLPPTIRARVSVEAGITEPWRLFVGDAGASIEVDHFGASAAYQKIYQEFGITAERVAAAARDSLARSRSLWAPARGRREGKATVSVDVLGQLSEAGVSVWLDDISRDRLRTGNLQMLIDDLHVVGVTSNPTIFAKSLSSGGAYDDQIADLRTRGVTVDEAARMITTYDIRWACDVFRPVYEQTGGLNGRVSLEVDPRLANETEKTVAEARALWWMVDRPNLMIKIPATLEGLPAITQAISEGITVNVTLIFGLERYGQVIDAYMAGLEQAAAAGRGLAQIRSVASFFVSRVDTEVDPRLDKIGTPEATALRGKAAVANARLAYELFEQRIATERWQALRAKGAQLQRPLWASTSVKDPSFGDTMYVVDLVVADTVNTMPEGTIRATADHGKLLGDTVHGTYDESRQVFADLAKLGIEYDDVVHVLELEGVDKFKASWTQLLDTIGAKMGLG